MLGKLLKHEYYYIFKTFTPVYIIFLAIAFIIKIVFSLKLIDSLVGATGPFAVGFTIFTYILIASFSVLLFIISLLTIVNNSKRFQKNMFSDEGYLTNTLPVTATEHIVAKLIAGISNYIVSLIVMIIGILIVASEEALYFLSAISEAITDDSTPVTVKLMVLLLLIVIFIAFMLDCYLSSALTSMVGGKKGMSIVIGIATYFIVSVSVSLITVFVDELGIESVEGMLALYVLYFAVIGAIEYFWIVNIIKKHLNLQ